MQSCIPSSATQWRALRTLTHPAHPHAAKKIHQKQKRIVKNNLTLHDHQTSTGAMYAAHFSNSVSLLRPAPLTLSGSPTFIPSTAHVIYPCDAAIIVIFRNDLTSSRSPILLVLSSRTSDSPGVKSGWEGRVLYTWEVRETLTGGACTRRKLKSNEIYRYIWEHALEYYWEYCSERDDLDKAHSSIWSVKILTLLRPRDRSL